MQKWGGWERRKARARVGRDYEEKYLKKGGPTGDDTREGKNRFWVSRAELSPQEKQLREKKIP